MDGETFDSLVKRLMQARLSRLDALRGGAASVLTGFVGIAVPEAESAANPHRKDKGKAQAKGKHHRGKAKGKGKSKGKRRSAHKADSPQRKCKEASRPCSFDTHCCAFTGAPGEAVCCNKRCCAVGETCVGGACVPTTTTSTTTTSTTTSTTTTTAPPTTTSTTTTTAPPCIANNGVCPSPAATCCTTGYVCGSGGACCGQEGTPCSEDGDCCECFDGDINRCICNTLGGYCVMTEIG